MHCYMTKHLLTTTQCQADLTKWTCWLQVVHLPKYRAWMSSFGEATEHIMVNSQAVPHTFPLTSSATLQVSPHLQMLLTVTLPTSLLTCPMLGALPCHIALSLQRQAATILMLHFVISKLCCPAFLLSCERMGQ